MKEAHARQSDTARPSTAVPMVELRVAKRKTGPLEVLDPDTSEEPDGSDLPPEYTVLDLTVPRTALASCATCRACGASGSMSRSTVLLHLTRVARLRGRAIWLMVCLRCFLSLLPRKSGGRPPVLFQFASHRNSNYVGCTLSTRVGKTLVDSPTPFSTHTHTHPVCTVCRQHVSTF